MKINLNLLRTFVQVAAHGSFRVASGDINRSQSAVSAQIKQLEEQIGTPLFHRTTRFVRLTTAGEQMMRAAQRSLGEIELGLREIRETANLESGQVALSCSMIVASTRLPPILAVFEHHYPAVRVYVTELNPQEMHESVRHSKTDFGIGPVVDSMDLEIEPLLTEDICALVPRRFLAADSVSITLRQIATMPILMLNDATVLRAIVTEAAMKVGVTFTPKYECTQIQTLISMAACGLGIAILPKSVIPHHLADTVQVLRFVSPSLSRQIGLITVRGRKLSPAAARLAGLIRELIGTDTVGAHKPSISIR